MCADGVGASASAPRCREVLSNIAYIINVRLARVFTRAHHAAISEHLPGDSISGCAIGDG